MRYLLGDRVTISSTNPPPDNPSFAGRSAVVCGLPRNGLRLVYLDEGGEASKVFAVQDDQISHAGMLSPRSTPTVKQPEFKVYVPPVKPTTYDIDKEPNYSSMAMSALKSSAAGPSEPPTKPKKSGKRGKLKRRGRSGKASSGDARKASSARGKKASGPDPARVGTFRLAFEDGPRLWDFERAETLASAREWKRVADEAASSIPTSSDEKATISPTAVIGWEFKRSKFRKVDGKDGRLEMPHDVLQCELNNAATLLHQKGPSDAKALRAALSLAEIWTRVHKYKEANDLMRSIVHNCITHADTRFYEGALQLMGFLHFKEHKYSTSVEMYRKLIQVSKQAGPAVRENLAYSYLAQCTGNSLLQAEAIFAEALMSTVPPSDLQQVASPGSPLAYAAALDSSVQKKLSDMSVMDKHDPHSGGASLGLGICRYLRGDYPGAYEMFLVSRKVIREQAKKENGRKHGLNMALAKASAWACLAAKEAGKTSEAEEYKRDSLKILQADRAEDTQIATNIKNLLR